MNEGLKRLPRSISGLREFSLVRGCQIEKREVSVPEGQADSSLAIYCLGKRTKGSCPVRDGLIEALEAVDNLRQLR
jgi:hypothetical protein